MKEFVLAVFAVALGGIIGSFLNACIHRMPRGLRLDEPKRSFCPSCNTTIRWYHNLPIVSWLWLRGRCAYCGVAIPPRYLLVELITASLFLWIWLAFPFPVSVAYWIFSALMIAATFIDFEHYIIPDEITIGGTVAGVVASTLIPSLMGQTEWWVGGLISLASAALGFGALWAVVEIGKIAFGKKRVVLDPPEAFQFESNGEEVRLVLGGELWTWDEIFSRDSDVLVIESRELRLHGKPQKNQLLRFRIRDVVWDKQTHSLEKPIRIEGVACSVVIPREAMGFGDVKFIACIGAFLGWQAVLFTLMASSVIGAVAGVLMLAWSRGKSGGKIPFGPYLALGAWVWMATGPALLTWYLGLLRPPMSL